MEQIHLVTFLACCTKNMTASINRKVTVLERLDVCFLLHFWTVFVKLIFETVVFLYTCSIHGLLKYFQMLTKCPEFTTRMLQLEIIHDKKSFTVQQNWLL